MKTAKSFALILLVLSAAVYARTPQDARDVRRVSIPGEKWAMELRLPGFSVEQDELRGDGKGRSVMASNQQSGYVLTIFLETIPHGETAAQLRDWDASGQKKSPLNPTDFKSGEYKQAATLEYTIKEFQGQKVNQKHFNAYVIHQGFWAHVHLSKIHFEPGDEKLFYTIVDSLKFTEGAAAASTASDPGGDDLSTLLSQGTVYFMRGDYTKAVGPYSKALELEKQKPQLSRDHWRVLVDNLTMAYGISGDLKSAKATAEYGLSKDPDYPLFHYLLANTYAGMGDLDNTILYLKQAFARKQNIIKGEQMPDPATDDSFKRFMNNEKFLAALKEINP